MSKDRLEVVLRYKGHEAVLPTRIELPTAEELAVMPPTNSILPEVDLKNAVAAELTLYLTDWKEDKPEWEIPTPSELLKRAVVELLMKSNEEFMRRAVLAIRVIKERDEG